MGYLAYNNCFFANYNLQMDLNTTVRCYDRIVIPFYKSVCTMYYLGYHFRTTTQIL